jgi:peptidoglycan hydrolase-like protein with peptidoglycan-binding domain
MLMKNIFIATLLIIPSITFATYNDVTLTTDAVISVGGYTLNVSGSSAVIESITVNESNFSVILGSGSSITIDSPTRNQLSTDVTSDVVSNTCSSAVSTLVLSYSGSGTITNVVTPSSAICSGSGIGVSSGSRPNSSGGSNNNRSNATTSPVVTVINKPNTTGLVNFIRDMAIGSQGVDVKALQVFLNTHGYVIVANGTGSPGDEGTYFGEKTRKAVILFQKANNITPAAGRVGPMTRVKINSLLGVSTIATTTATTSPVVNVLNTFVKDLKQGDSGPDVLLLQKYLNTHGFVITTSGGGAPGSETDTFGSLTKQALIKFQISKGLPGTGFFGPLTRAAVNKK